MITKAGSNCTSRRRIRWPSAAAASRHGSAEDGGENAADSVTRTAHVGTGSFALPAERSTPGGDDGVRLFVRIKRFEYTPRVRRYFYARRTLTSSTGGPTTTSSGTTPPESERGTSSSSSMADRCVLSPRFFDRHARHRRGFVRVRSAGASRPSARRNVFQETRSTTSFLRIVHHVAFRFRPPTVVRR